MPYTFKMNGGETGIAFLAPDFLLAERVEAGRRTLYIHLFVPGTRHNSLRKAWESTLCIL